MEPAAAIAPRNERAPIRRALVCYNQKAGAVQPGDKDRLAALLTQAGVSRHAIVGAEKLRPSLLARADAFDVIIVLGGDGSARAAATMAPSGGPPLILLPGGTLNVLPKALYGELAWPEALKAALERGVERLMPSGRANGERFFVAAMFGAPTVLARAREAVRDGRVLTAVRRLRSYLRRAFTRGIRGRINRQRFLKAEAIGALLPAFSGELDGGSLEWVHLKASHFVDLARVGVRALGEGWREDQAVDIWNTSYGEVASNGLIPATLDGEPHTFFSRVKVSFDGAGVRVLALPLGRD